MTNDDVAGARALAAEKLHAEALALTVATVAAGTACFFMCHEEVLPE
ncbi:cyclic lactone autoinducer peptide [Sphingomonas daechungensis]